MTGKRILAVDDDPFNLKIVRNLLHAEGYEILTAESAKDAYGIIEKQAIDLILLDLIMPEIDGFAACMELRRNPKTTNTPIILLTAQDSLEQKIKGFEAGADAFITKPFVPPELLVRIQSLLRRFDQAPTDFPTKEGKVLAVFSLRGGVGTTTLSNNIAIALASLWRQRVALVDLVLAAGQSALTFNLAVRHSWGDMARCSLKDIDEEMVDTILRSHDSGVRVLASPNTPEEGEGIDGAKVTRVLEILRGRYEYVVIDLPHDFNETTLVGIDAANEILMPLAPEIASVRAASIALNALQRRGRPKEDIHLAINWTFEQQGLAQKDIESALDHPITFIVPFAPESLLRSVNRGVPLLQSEPESPLSELFVDIAYYLSKDEHTKKRPDQQTKAWLGAVERQRAREAG
ncbi:MAG: response regulator [Anaerolineales bacterium]|nr:response regulator [Anaerolineales bacterium]